MAGRPQAGHSNESYGPLKHVTPWGQVLKWRLPILMAMAGFRFATQLHEALKADGVELSYSHVHRLTQNAPERLNVDVQFALCRILNCSVNDLWEIAGQVATESEPSPEVRQKLKSIKPVRARGLE